MTKTPNKHSNAIRQLASFILVPTLAYVCTFVLLTYPLITNFRTIFMGDSNDVYQNVWSLWWFQQAVDQAEVDLWHTNMLYAPQGTSLRAHALSPLHGVLSYPLQKIMPWHQVYNSLIIFNFVATGLSLFWLAYYYTKSWFPSLIAGAFYTFSAYHFLHSRGHMEMAAMQWFTLFVLAFVWLLDNPRWQKAVVTSGLLLLTFWNTPYYFLYSLMVGTLLATAYLWRFRKDEKRRTSLIRGLIIFAISSALIVGPSVWSFYSHSRSDDLSGAHDPFVFSAEVFDYVARPNNRLGDATKSWWPSILQNPEDNLKRSGEAQVRLSLIVLILVIIGLKYSWRKDTRVKFWLGIGITFLILSLGPRFQFQGDLPIISGEPVHISLPYAWLTRVVPILKQSGVTARMAAIPLLSVCLLAAYGLRYLQQTKKYLLIVVLLTLFVIETVPRKMNPAVAATPDSMKQLSNLPTGILLDRAHPGAIAMYYQIFHKQPLVEGYVSRVTQTNFDTLQNFVVGQKADNLDDLCQNFQIRYLWTAIPLEGIKPILIEQHTNLYDLKPNGSCVAGS